MRPLALLVIAATAWWLHKRNSRPAPAVGTTIGVLGDAYEVVGPRTASGLVPVLMATLPGRRPADVTMYNPKTGTIANAGGIAPDRPGAGTAQS